MFGSSWKSRENERERGHAAQQAELLAREWGHGPDALFLISDLAGGSICVRTEFARILSTVCWVNTWQNNCFDRRIIRVDRSSDKTFVNANTILTLIFCQASSHLAALFSKNTWNFIVTMQVQKIVAGRLKIKSKQRLVLSHTGLDTGQQISGNKMYVPSGWLQVKSVGKKVLHLVIA